MRYPIMRGWLAVMFFAVVFPVTAQDLSLAALTIPAELRENAKSVVREYHQVYRAETPRTATLSVRRVVTLLDDGHGGENQLVIRYDDDTRISGFKATVYDALGQKLRDVKKSEIEDVMAISGGQFYTDARVKTVRVAGPGYPYTVEVEYDLKMEDFGAMAGAPHWRPQGFDQSVESASLTAYIHAGNELLYRANELPEPSLSTDGGFTVMKWEVKNLPARRAESEAPPSSEVLPFLTTSLRDFIIDQYLLTNRNWGAFGKQMLQLHQDIRSIPPALEKDAAAAVEGLTTDREKIGALYRLLQERTRYVGVQLGVGGWRPFSATYVEENRFGDCKALSNYMGAMLDAQGIDNYPVLVYWGDRPPLAVEPDFTASAFNHMILYVPSEDMYLECTSNASPPGYLGDGKQDRHVLWLTPEGGKLVKTPAHEPGEHGYVRTVELDISPEGDADFALRAGYFGSRHEDIRRFLHGESDETKRREALHGAGELPDVSGEDFSVAVDPDKPELEMAYRTTLPRYVRKLGKRMFVPLNKLYRWDFVPEQLAERRFPIRSIEAEFLVDTVHLTLPENLEIESLGEAETVLEHPVGEYRAQVIAAPGKLTWIRTLKLVPVELPAAEYENYRQFFVEVSKAERRQVVLREKRTK